MSTVPSFSISQLAKEGPPASELGHIESEAKRCELQDFSGTESGGWQEVEAALSALRGRDGVHRMEAEARLTESLARIKRSYLDLTDYVERGDIGMQLVGPDGRIVWANKTKLEQLGYDWEEYVGQPAGEFYADQSVAQGIAERVKNGEPLHRVPARLRAKDGSVKHVLVNTSLRDAGGQPHYTRCFTLDVTEPERLAGENALLRSALDGAIEGVALIRGDRVVYTNCAMARLFGYGRSEELLGCLWRDLHGPTELAYLAREAFPALRRRGQWRGTTFAQRRDGAPFVKQISLKALTEGHLLVVCSDISELDAARQRLETAHMELTARCEQLRQVKGQLEVAVRQKDEFLTNMSHELRTPLTAMLGMTDVLRDEIHGSLLPAQKRSVEIIASSSQHLLGLINDILDLAKIGARMLQLNLESVSAARVCEAVIEIVQPLAEAKGVELTFQIAPEVRNIRADERRLRQILLNLVGNGVKFTPDQGAVRLSVTANDAGRTVSFSVSDTGIGITPEALQEVFQPFKQLHGGLARNYEGTGLGLALARNLAELHGGQLIVESTVGKGSCFTVSLPQGGACALPLTGGPISVPASGTKQHHLRVLLVDDNVSSLEAIGAYLSAKGWVVSVATSGLAAIAQVGTSEFELILMDIQMPGMDGLEAIRRVRSLPQGHTVPIIALTALAMAGDEAKCLAAGADHYLSKPVALSELNQQMHQLLAKATS